MKYEFNGMSSFYNMKKWGKNKRARGGEEVSVEDVENGRGSICEAAGGWQL